ARWTPPSVLTGGSDVLPAQMALAVLHIRRYGRSAMRATVEVSVADSGVTPCFVRGLGRLALRIAIGAGLAALAWLLSSAISAGTQPVSAPKPTPGIVRTPVVHQTAPVSSPSAPQTAPVVLRHVATSVALQQVSVSTTAAPALGVPKSPSHPLPGPPPQPAPT